MERSGWGSRAATNRLCTTGERAPCAGSPSTIALLALGILLSGSLPASGQAPLLLRDVTLVPIASDEAQARPGQSILIHDDRIVAVGPDQEIRAPRRARVVDGSGRFVIPGLTDGHVHIKRSSADLDRLLPMFLAHGVTTVINLDGSPRVLALRDEIAAGERLGPRIYSSGPIVRGHDGMTAEEGARIAVEHVEAGYDFLKLYNGVPEAAYHALVARAREAGLPVVGHAVRSVGIDGAIESRQHIVHMEEIVYGDFTWRGRPDFPADLPDEVGPRLDRLLDPGRIETLAKRIAEAGIFVTPNLTAYHHIERQLVDLEKMLARPGVSQMPASMTRSWQRDRNGYFHRPDPERFLDTLQRTFPFLQQLTLAFHRAGVPLLAGTDVGIPVILAGSSLHDELEELVLAGLTPREALAAATITAADFVGCDDCGRIAPGHVADLVLLREDPLVDIASSRTVDAVVVRGRVLEGRLPDG